MTTSPRVFEHTQMLHDPESRHLDLRLEFGERLTILGEQSVEYQAPGRIGQCLEDVIVVHESTIGDHLVTCQRP